MSPKEILIANLKSEYGLNLDGLINEIRRYMPDVNENKIRKTFSFAAEAHAGQFRKDNKPYITHPFETAGILASMHVDEDSIIAAFLHDVPEDTSFGMDVIEEQFGKKIAYLVDGITKLAKVHYQHDMEHRQIESLKKLFLHTTKDPRIILIKLADRLHNMRTLQYIEKEQKRVRISRETMEIFVPIANLLGMEEMKTELEDLCFRFLLPDEYETLAERMKRTRDAHMEVLSDTVETLEREFIKQKLNATVVGRQRNLYGIYKKVTGKTRRIDEFDNLIAIRVIMQEKEDCYRALGIIHSIFRPRPGKFKDYIAVPKINGYQSIHTTVFGPDGLMTEIQIRTNRMHLEAEYGIASQYFNAGIRDKKHLMEEDGRSQWVEKIMQLQKLQEHDKEFMEDLKRDVLHDRIFVFTPQGESVDLPQSATCIDFAYQIHTQVGHLALKADVNGEIVPMATSLQNGDTVRIITSASPKGPDRSWLPFAKTNTARKWIRDYFNKTSREDKIGSGKVLLQKELDRAGLGLLKDISNRKIKMFCEKNGQFLNFMEVLAAIGEGSLRPVDFVNQLYQHDSATLGLLKWLEIPIRIKHSPSFTPVAIKIISKDSVGQMERILKTISSLHINVIRTKAYISFWTGDFICRQLLAIQEFSQVSELFENLEQLEGVKKVERRFWQRNMFFLFGMGITFVIWAAHPFLLHYLALEIPFSAESNVINPLNYLGLMLLFLLVFMLKNITSRSFPEFRETSVFWGLTFLLSGFAAITVLAEIYFFNLNFNIPIVAVSIFLIFGYLTYEYLTYRQRLKNRADIS